MTLLRQGYAGRALPTNEVRPGAGRPTAGPVLRSKGAKQDD